MTAPTPPIVAEKPAALATVWHVGQRPNARAGFPILTDRGAHAGFSFNLRNARLFAAAPGLLWLAKVVVEADPDDCRLDHDGLCQAHWLGNPCEVAVARRLVAQIEGQL